MKQRGSTHSRKRGRHDRYAARYAVYFRSLVPANLPSVRKLLESSASRFWRVLSSLLPPVPRFITYLFSVWFSVIYYFYFTLPLTIMAFSWSLSITFLYFWSRNSPLVKKFLIHASAIVEVLVNIGIILADTSISVLVVDGIQLLVDVVTSFLDWRVSEANSQAMDVPSMTFAELNDLLYYEEMSDEEGDDILYERLGKGVMGFGNASGEAGGGGALGGLLGTRHPSPGRQSMRRKMKQHMHQYIPPHTFRATIRVKGGATEATSSSASGESTSSVLHQSSETSSVLTPASPLGGGGGGGGGGVIGSQQRPNSPLLCPSEDEGDGEEEVMLREARAAVGQLRERGRSTDRSSVLSGEGSSVQDIVSPMSFPATPYSRAQVMNKNAERVISTIFSARDILRLELLSTSSDETSRRAAFEAKNNKKMAVFDPFQTSEGLSLTCGNHCLMKVGKGLCYSSRSMLPLRRDVYVYYEFSVTASHKQVPVLSIGLSNSFAPLSTMVGSSEMSLGVRSDGRLLIRSIWHSPAELHCFSPGSTVGFLVYVGSDPARGKKISGSSSSGAGAGEVRSSLSSPLSTPPSSSNDRAGTVSPERGLERPNTYEEEDRDDADNHPLYASLAINVDGNVLQLDERATTAVKSVLLESVEKDLPLFPTVSLLSPQVRVWCRFCEADILMRNPVAIGVPKHVPEVASNMYCLDGSRL